MYAAEQKRPDVHKASEISIESSHLEDANKFIFLDESGLHLGMSSLYGRCKSDERLKSFSPFDKGTRVTMIAAIGVEEVKAATYGAWHVDGDIFLSFIRLCLAPALKPGQIVLMDNLSTHKVSGVRELIESTGAKLVYLPPYSPDLSPIELFWSKIKNSIRRKAARTFPDLKKAISVAFRSVKHTDLVGWFQHCGYNVD